MSSTKNITPERLDEISRTRSEGGVCRWAGICGGCSYQGVSYDDQLKNKEGEILGYLSEAGIKPERYESIEGCPEGARTAYRNKMEYTFGDMYRGGSLCLGLHRKKQFMSVITTDDCMLVTDDFNKILRGTLDFCVEKGYPKYHKKLHEGLLRNLMIREGKRTHELLVNIVTSSDGEFDEQGWLDMLHGLDLESMLVGVCHTINDDIADKVTCDELRVLEGRSWYMEKICGLEFKVNLFSFFQTNVEAVERMYLESLSQLDDFASKNVFDLYCGTGTISQIAASKAAHVTGIEIVQDSVDAARENVRLNGITNCDFICGDVFKTLENTEEKPDVIIADPPRAGMGRDAVSKIASYGVPQILYISCNPKTLVQDLAQFITLGYKVSYFKPYENFAYTKHVEACCLLARSSVSEDRA
ncbi:MAG: 23S rRNA (uracil(1939)-C(5))-methyltransferase RlmD [Anaerovoracaceae bacterium]